MLTQPQRLRRFAMHVLLVWLFALGIGVVNACTVHPARKDGAPALVQHHDVAAAAQHAGADAKTGHQPCHDAPGCERLCDGPSVAPRAERQLSDLLSGLWLAPAPMALFDLQPFDVERTLPSEPVRRRESVPIAIALLRLTL